ncbi:MAG: diguanylate cyclase [Chloroflexi bacterium]|nr:diguanylate cyclase [Chloroflexota bacterium]
MKNTKILYLHTFSSDADHVARALEKNGLPFEFRLVNNDQSLLEECQTFQPDLVLVDDSFSASDEWNAMQIAERECPDVPVILLSDEIHESELAEVIRLAVSVQQGQGEDGAHRLHQTNQRMLELIGTIEDGLITLDCAWRITYANLPAAQFIGVLPGELIGRNLWEQFPALLGTPIETHYRAVMTQRIPVRFEAKGVMTEAKYEIRVHPSSEGIAIYAINITERTRTETQLKQLNQALEKRIQELEAERMRWQGVVEGIADEVWICTPDGKISLINLPSVTPMGLEEFENKTIEELYQEVDILNLDGTLRPVEDAPLLRSVQGKIVRGEEIMRHRETGRLRYREYSSAPMRDAEGKITGSVAIVRDITDFKTAQAQIAQLARFPDENPYPILRISSNGLIRYANAAAAPVMRIWQLVAGQPVPDFWRALIDRTLASSMPKELVEQAEDRTYHFTLVPVMPGDYVNVYGIDITDLKRAESELARVNEQLAERAKQLEDRNSKFALLNKMGGLLESCQTLQEAYRVIAEFGTLLFDGDCGVVYRISNLHDQTETVTAWGNPPVCLTDNMFHPDQCWALRRGQVHLVQNVETGLVCQHVLRNVELGVVGSALCIPMLAQGEVVGLLQLQSQINGIAVEKQQLAETVAEHLALVLASIQLRETLQEMAIRDPLTGLFNRRYFAQSLERELHRAKRHKRQVGILMIDVDHFKAFNDTYGHDVGDMVLRSLAEELESQVRKEDVVCRYGGEEFAVILPDASLADSVERAEQLRQHVQTVTLSNLGQPFVNITASFGVAIFPQHGETAEKVLRASDVALYQAKSSGRNRVVSANPI